MKKDQHSTKETFFQKVRRKISGTKVDLPEKSQAPDEEKSHMLELFEAVKKSPGHITGWDFDRAFDFIERYPDTSEAEILIGQMYATSGQQLKGLSYASAIRIIETMPGHAGRESIIKGIYKLEPDYIQELRSDVIAGILKIIPDHPLAENLTRSLATKNLTNAYDFVTTNPTNTYTKQLIKAMFERDPNISLLLFQEKMDHPNASSIFEGIYSITRQSDIEKLTPNAVLFVLDIAPDHPKIQEMIRVLVEQNYIKAYEFTKMHSDHALADELKKQILKRKPELEKLFNAE